MVCSNLESQLEQNEAMTRRQRNGVEQPGICCGGGMAKTQVEICLGAHGINLSLPYLCASSPPDLSQSVNGFVNLVETKEVDCHF